MVWGFDFAGGCCSGCVRRERWGSQTGGVIGAGDDRAIRTVCLFEKAAGADRLVSLAPILRDKEPRTDRYAAQRSEETLIGQSESSWSSGCSTASTLLDEKSSVSLIRAIFRGDLVTALEHFRAGIPVPAIATIQGLLEHPDMDLSRRTSSKDRDGIIHFLLHFADDRVKLCLRYSDKVTQQRAQGDTILHLLCGLLDTVSSPCEDEHNHSFLRFLFAERSENL
ncbi:ankyrin repeat-containing protein [Colletotrichum sojae]|uniref:Ankyrin repeat-containing protein n=1 Tax=Colletotrichum sojae TaxID=2175907 RepID=A0A8H6MMT3_9PEZI|nr:ankyrin repeat-containing protein [Colletotrichum sojae]